MISNTPNPFIGIILVNYNRLEMMKECIDSILKQTWKNLRIILVENGSEQELKINLYEWAQDKPVSMIDLPENTGFCRGTNIGTQKALDMNCDHVLWLNNDTIIDRFCLESLEARMRMVGPNATVTGKILYADDPLRLWYAGGYLDYVQGIGKHSGFRKLDEPKWDNPRRVTYSTGCIHLLPVGIIKQVGFLQEKFFMYMDDTEFSFRLKKHRIPIWYEPKAKVFHKIGSGVKLSERSGLYLYLTTRNRPHVVNNPLYKSYLALITLAISAAKIAVLGFKSKSFRWLRIKSVLYGLSDMLRLSKSPWNGYPWMSQNY